MFAIIDDLGNLGTQVLAWDDAIDETMFEQELAGLEAFGQLQTHRVPDGPFTGESDQGARFGQGDVALEGETGRHAAHGRVGQYRNVQPAGAIVPAQGG